ncbi:uncharacterized protein EDB93DRAFT_1109587 [Suillus bovinus]|uniref:uncharacterized protein n=1 Tax=Suillus bovinus TaxID=48563 RepID=UPI001B866F2F|nr:uncharacterized protein EDB93DRAFT_1109587 [Suillus bovinus]KAG2126629.1 hypothetical protein EDB93DRAFT_1109587 [Suillus bovinus]
MSYNNAGDRVQYAGDLSDLSERVGKDVSQSEDERCNIQQVSGTPTSVLEHIDHCGMTEEENDTLYVSTYYYELSQPITNCNCKGDDFKPSKRTTGYISHAYKRFKSDASQSTEERGVLHVLIDDCKGDTLTSLQRTSEDTFFSKSTTDLQDTIIQLEHMIDNLRDDRERMLERHEMEQQWFLRRIDRLLRCARMQKTHINKLDEELRCYRDIAEKQDGVVDGN